MRNLFFFVGCILFYLLFTGCPTPSPNPCDFLIENAKPKNKTKQFILQTKIPFPTLPDSDPSIIPDTLRKELRDKFGFHDSLKLKIARKCGCYFMMIESETIDIEDETRQASARSRQQGDNIESIDFNFQIQIDVTDTIEPLATLPSFFPSIGARESIKVAIIDSGVDYLHKSLEEKIWINPLLDTCFQSLDTAGFNFKDYDANLWDYSGHGTHINGIIANNFPDGSIELELMNLKIFDKGGKSDLFSAACALQYALNQKVDIINMSWGYYSKDTSTILLNLLTKAAKSNILIVSSAGNDSINIDNCFHWPSHYSNFDPIIEDYIVAGAKMENYDSLARYSNFGKEVDIAALGTIKSTIPSTQPRNSFGLKEGTSMSTALITRSAAMWKAKNRGSNEDFIDAIIISGDTLNLQKGKMINNEKYHDPLNLNFPPLNRQY